MRSRGWTIVAAGVAVAALALPAAASADCAVPTDPPDATFDGPVRNFDGTFAASMQGSYVQIPFDVPAGTTAIRVRYCYDQPPPPDDRGNTLDVGVYEPLKAGDTVYGPAEQRGWSGSAVKDLAIAVNGFSPPATYEDDRKAFVHPYTTRAYQPGPIPAGRWAVELGLAAITGPPTDPDGIDWRVRVETSTSPQWSASPYARAPYDPSPAAAGFGWYAGDVHVHGEQEPGNSLMSTSFDFAFEPLAAGGAGLDFVGLVDHNNNVNAGEIGRYQPDYPGKLIIPGTEVTTYKGHYNNIGSASFADFRGGPVYRWTAPGTLTKVAEPVAPASQFGAIQSSGGWTQINHPTVLGGSICRGCPWDYTDADTDYSKVDAIEVQNGAADFGMPPNTVASPFTATAIAFYERALAAGAHVAAVGSSDAHQTDTPGATIGEATTVVGAGELSRSAIVQGIHDDRTYVKLYGNDGPDIRVTARAPGDTFKTLGDTLRGPSAKLDVQVLRAGAGAARPASYTVRLLREGTEVAAAPITGDDFSTTFDSTGSGRYSIKVTRSAAPSDRIEVYSSPVWYEVGPAFHLGKAKRNKKNGTAKLEVADLRVPGELEVSGKGLKTKSKSAGPGAGKLKIKPKGKLAKKLKRKGKAKVNAEIRFVPDGGEPAQLDKRVKLKRKRKHGGGHR